MFRWTPRGRHQCNHHAPRARRHDRQRRRPSFEALDERVLLTATPPLAVGININAVNEYTHALMFNDLMKYAGDWVVVPAHSLENTTVTGVPLPSLDQNGYPIGLGTLPALGYALTTFGIEPGAAHAPLGAYSLIFDGKGTVVVHQSSQNQTTITQNGGTGAPHPVTIVANGLYVYTSITASDPTDHVRNIRLIMPGYQATYQTQPFYTPFLHGLQPFTGPLRFMDAMQTNGQQITDWSQRTTALSRTQTQTTGLAVEYMVDLANTLGKDMWVNMPYQADDAYVRGFAQYVHDHLNPGLKVDVEYGNEDWNYIGIFKLAYNYVDAYAQAHGLTFDQATADLAAHDWAIWRSVYGAGANTTVVRVAAIQLAGWRLDQELQRLVATADPADPNHGFDVVSAAPYFGPDISSYTAATTTGQIVADSLAAATAIDADVDRFLAVRNKWEQTLGRDIPAIMYEGGISLVPPSPTVPWYQAYLGAQTDPGMYQVNQAYLDGLRQHGVDGLVYYSFIYPPSQYGEWGSMDYLGEPAAQTPKYNALRDYATGQLVLPTISGLAVAGLAASAPAGTMQTITITARDPAGTVAPDYLGTVHFTSTDPQAVLPADIMFTPADKGLHTFTVVLKTAGAQTVTATDSGRPGITGTQAGATITPLAVSALQVAGFPATTTAGVAAAFTVSAQDVYGNVIPSYVGTVHFTSSNLAALPADYTFKATDKGAHTFTAALRSAGDRSLVATDTAHATITGAEWAVVTPAAFSQFNFSSFPSPWAAASSQSFKVAAYDAYWNAVPSYAGTVHFTSTDPKAVLPPDYRFTTADKGSHTFTAMLMTMGYRSVTLADTVSGPTATAYCTVSPSNPASALLITGYPSATTAGDPRTFTVTARDRYGNVAIGYTGTVHFTSNDSQAALPADYTFSAADNGMHTFSVTLKTAGARSVTSTDTVATAIAGTLSSIPINPAAAGSLAVASVLNVAAAGTVRAFTVTAKDAYGNVASGYTGAVHFTSTDPKAALPADYTFTPANAGSHTFAAILKSTGIESITAADKLAGTLIGTQSGIAVNPAGAGKLAIAGDPASTTAGNAQSFTVTARDVYGNVVTGYAGTVHFASNDPRAMLPADYAFKAADRGAHTFSVTFQTAGYQSLTMTDAAAGLRGGSGGFRVTPGAAASVTVTSYPSSVVAGSAHSFVVTAYDAYGNVATAYTGAMHFRSDDAEAKLPADHTFIAADGGTHTFTAALKTAGSWSITATDEANSQIAGTRSGIAVTPAAASAFAAVGLAGSMTAGVPSDFALAAQDAYGNIVTGYAGTVHFSSDDPRAELPADYSFTAANKGAHTFTAVLKTAGSWSITATDKTNSRIAGTWSGIAVTPAGASTFVLDGLAGSATAGVAREFTLVAQDTLGNVVTGYAGTVHFSSDDPRAALPADYSFTAADKGAHTFIAVPRTAGSWSITASDKANSRIAGTRSGIAVPPAAASTFAVVGLAGSVTAGAACDFALVALDAYGNIVTGYTGTVHFSSDDPRAELPADYTFTAADRGMHAFTVRFRRQTSSGVRLTVVDTAAPPVFRSVGGIQVS